MHKGYNPELGAKRPKRNGDLRDVERLIEDYDSYLLMPYELVKGLQGEIRTDELELSVIGEHCLQSEAGKICQAADRYWNTRGV
jgi:hypothetical protein